MKKKFVFISLIIMIGLFIGGLVILLSSTDIGRDEGFKAMSDNGGSMDTNAYYNIIESTTENYRSAGMIISLIGGLGLIISGYGVYKEI